MGRGFILGRTLSRALMSDPTTAVPAAPAPPVEMVNVQVDGVWMKFAKGTRMIKALEEAGKLIPHYCYHPKLSSPGNCRMCLVETGMPAPARAWSGRG